MTEAEIKRYIKRRKSVIQAICDFCGAITHKEFVHKIEIKPWFDARTVKHVYRREFDACHQCAKAIEHRLIMIENNYLWRGKDPNRRYKNWTMETQEQMMEGDHGEDH